MREFKEKEIRFQGTCGRDISVERNSRTGMAICTVAEILLKFNNTWKSKTFMI